MVDGLLRLVTVLIFKVVRRLHPVELFLAKRLAIYQGIIQNLQFKQFVATPAPARTLVAVIDERELAFSSALGAFHTEH